MNLPNGWELILVLLVVVLVFGAKRLPDSARAVGRSMRILKAETKGLRDDDAPTSTTHASVVTPVPPVQPVVASPEPVQATTFTKAQDVAQPYSGQQPYAGQQLFDAQGRPVQVPAAGSVPVPQAPPA